VSSQQDNDWPTVRRDVIVTDTAADASGVCPARV
jgi:hypothetical protein